MRTADICPTCSTYSNALCTLYNGAYLSTLDIQTLDSLEVALNQLETWASTISIPTLQIVLDAGNSATSPDTSNQIAIDLQNSGAGYFNYFANDGAGVYTETYIDKTEIYLNGASGAFRGYIGILEGIPEINYIESSLSSIVKFNSPIANTTLNFPAKSVGTYTIATTEDYTLQSVLDNGNYAESPDTNSYIQSDLIDSGAGKFDSYISNGSIGSGIYSTIFTAQIYSDGDTTGSVVDANNTNLAMTVYNASGQTYLNFLVPTANTTLQFPAKAAGTYTLATTSDTSPYLIGWEIDGIPNNVMTLGKGVGKLTFTNGSAVVIGSDGVDFNNELDFDSPFFFYEATIILADGTHRYVSLDSHSTSTDGLISAVYSGAAYDGAGSSTWDAPSGTYEYYPYMIPITTSTANNFINFNTGSNNLISGAGSGNYVGGSDNQKTGNGNNNIIHGRDNTINANSISSSAVFGGNWNFSPSSTVANSLFIGSSSTTEDYIDTNITHSLIGGVTPILTGSTGSIQQYLIFGSSHTLTGPMNSGIITGESHNVDSSFSATFGRENFSRTIGEFTSGLYGTDYTPLGSGTAINAADRLFNVGNGTSTGSKSDAFTILKNGKVGIDIDNFEGSANAAKLQVNGAIHQTGSTVAGLPTGAAGMRSYVTDATAPTYLGALTGGGTVTCPVFHNGTIWVSA